MYFRVWCNLVKSAPFDNFNPTGVGTAAMFPAPPACIRLSKPALLAAWMRLWRHLSQTLTGFFVPLWYKNILVVEWLPQTESPQFLYKHNYNDVFRFLFLFFIKQLLQATACVCLFLCTCNGVVYQKRWSGNCISCKSYPFSTSSQLRWANSATNFGRVLWNSHYNKPLVLCILDDKEQPS